MPFPPPFVAVCKYRRGKPWEIWSCVMMSGRQTVDTHVDTGAVPDINNSCLSGVFGIVDSKWYCDCPANALQWVLQERVFEVLCGYCLLHVSLHQEAQ